MTVKKQELYNVIDTLSDEFSSKVLEYIEYLKFTDIVKDTPKNLIIKDKDDLREKLEEGIKDTDNGKVCSIDDAFDEIETMLM